MYKIVDVSNNQRFPSAVISSKYHSVYIAEKNKAIVEKEIDRQKSLFYYKGKRVSS